MYYSNIKNAISKIYTKLSVIWELHGNPQSHNPTHPFIKSKTIYFTDFCNPEITYIPLILYKKQNLYPLDNYVPCLDLSELQIFEVQGWLSSIIRFILSSSSMQDLLGTPRQMGHICSYIVPRSKFYIKLYFIIVECTLSANFLWRYTILTFRFYFIFRSQTT